MSRPAAQLPRQPNKATANKSPSANLTPLQALQQGKMDPTVMLQEVRREIWQRDCRRFIEDAIKIEDRDKALSPTAEGIAIPFKLWDHGDGDNITPADPNAQNPSQADVLAAFLYHKLTISLKARQLGLSWLALAYAVWRMVHNPGYSVVGVSKKEDDAKELVRRVKFILKHLPSHIAVERTSVAAGRAALAKAEAAGIKPPVIWEATATDITIYHDKGEPSTFMALTSAPSAARSFTANLIILDEWAFHPDAAAIWEAAYPTINRPGGGQVIGISTAEMGTFFEEVFKDAWHKKNTFHAIFLPWWTDPRRTKQWYENTKKDLKTYKKEYPATPEEAFSAGEGAAFSEFAESIHVCKTFQPPHYWKRWRANDPGYTDPFAWYWYAVGEDGTVYIYREYTREHNDPRITYSDQARQVTKLSMMQDTDTGQKVKEKVLFTVVGRDAFNQHPETGKSMVDYYREGGVTGCIEPPRDNNRTDRILRKAVWHEYLRPYKDENTSPPRTRAKIVIMDCCVKLIETLPALVVDPNDPEKVAESRIDHWFDGSSYGLVTWHATVSTPPKPEETEIQKHKRSLMRNQARQMRNRMVSS